MILNMILDRYGILKRAWRYPDCRTVWPSRTCSMKLDLKPIIYKNISQLQEENSRRRQFCSYMGKDSKSILADDACPSTSHSVTCTCYLFPLNGRYLLFHFLGTYQNKENKSGLRQNWPESLENRSKISHLLRKSFCWSSLIWLHSTPVA